MIHLWIIVLIVTEAAHVNVVTTCYFSQRWLGWTNHSHLWFSDKGLFMISHSREWKTSACVSMYSLTSGSWLLWEHTLNPFGDHTLLQPDLLMPRWMASSVAVSSFSFIHTLLSVRIRVRLGGMLGLAKGSIGLGMFLQNRLLNLSGLVRENLHLCFGQC